MPSYKVKPTVHVVKRKKAVQRRKAPALRKAPARRKPQRRSGGGGGMFAAGGSALGRALGSAFGPVGSAAGGVLGGLGGSVLSKIIGHGDYQISNAPVVNQNTLLSNSANIPQFGTGKVSSNFKHREFLGDITSSSTIGAFKIQDFPVNPGLPITFPWLSGVVGGNFQQYRINGMTFEYRTMSADALNSTNTALGSVVMSTDYDSADSTFANKINMENTEYGTSCKPSSNMLHAIECERSQTPVSELYVRSFAVPIGKDIRMYDMCRFSIATVGCQAANTNLGELWVTYDIDVFKAKDSEPLYIAGIAEYTLPFVTIAAPFGHTGQIETIDTIGLDFPLDNVSIGTRVNFPLTIQEGSVYALDWYADAGATGNMTAQQVGVTGGFTLYNGNDSWVNPEQDQVGNLATVHILCKFLGGANPLNPPGIILGGWSGPTPTNGSKVSVTQVSGLAVLND
ncbi:capsid protein [Crucivirus-359]|nr:capsid protein [Crucivirus-359]